MGHPTIKMHYFLISLQMCLLGLAASDNSTVDDASVFIGTGIHGDSEAVGQNVAWGEYSPWSKWSPCSRSCGGGISRQLRRCRRKPCKGKSWNVKYKVCNNQNCVDPIDFRAEQCAAFDSVPYSGQLLKWYPHHDPKRPCSLICRGVQSGVDRDSTNDFRRTRKLERTGDNFDNDDSTMDAKNQPTIERDNDDNLATEFDTDDAIVVQLADKVEDGTRCHTETTDVCIAGSCSKVGCDMRVGSNKNKDACGVCGGNGSSCQPRYSWSLESISACSKSCGGGFKMATPICKSLDQSVTDDSQCDAYNKPNKTLLPCNAHACTTKWITGEWSRCSSSCGGGSRTRAIFCTEENGNETTKLPDHRCNPIYKPRYQDSCNEVSCPTWQTSQWSQCSASCGKGVRTRRIECQNGDGTSSSGCDASKRPRDEQDCRTNVPCVTYSEEMTKPLAQTYPAPSTPENLIDQKVPTEATFIADDWSTCSATCGDGIRHRAVHCKIFLEFSRTIAILPDNECAGPKPSSTEKCVVETCGSLDNSVSYRVDTVGDSGYEESNLMDSYRSSSGTGHEGYESSVKVASGSTIQTTYSWKEAGYTSCSATCLGGVQELRINCVRDDDGHPVVPLLCTKETKPELRIRTCNDHPCPPRWNYGEFGECQSPCGLGIQTRDVTCIHEVARGPEGTISLPNHMCKSLPDADRQHCNVLDCEVAWQHGEWSRCSKSCGNGIKRRKVACEQVMAQGHKQYRSDRDCPGPKPQVEKPCNTKPCEEMGPGAQPTIQTANTSFVQRNPGQKVDLKIGGTATVFSGTSVVKIRCPVKKFKRNQIEWTKNGEELKKSRKHKITQKGALKILDVTYTDEGIYACIAGQSHAEIRLIVSGRPRDQMSSEEILRSGNTVHHRQNVNLDSAQAKSGENLQIDRSAPGYRDGLAFGSDDLSQENRPEVPGSGKSTKKSRKKKPRPSSTPPDSSMAHGEYTVTSLNQPGYQESIESIASSGASQLKPHLNQLISSLKAYWPFQSDSNLINGHRVAPPMLLDDFQRNSPRINRARDRTNDDFNRDRRENELKIFNRQTLIPDDIFGPDEERIFIDDEPYDLDAAFFAIHHEEPPKIRHETTTIDDDQSLMSHREFHRPDGNDESDDNIERSLSEAKPRDENVVDDRFDNQRGTEISNYDGETNIIEPSREEATNRRPTIDVVDSKTANEEKISDGGTLDDTLEKKIEKKSAHSDDYEKDDGDARNDDSTFSDGVSRLNVESEDHVRDRTTTRAPEMTTLLAVEESVRKDGRFRSELSFENIDDDGETSREKSEIRCVNQTDSDEATEDKIIVKIRVSEGPKDFVNETSEHGSSSEKEMTKENVATIGEDEKIQLAVVRSRDSSREIFLNDSAVNVATLAFDDNGSSNETTIGGSVNIFRHGSGDDLSFEWVTTEWSKCSQTCGGGGFQMRGAQCTVRQTKPANDTSRIIPRAVIGASLCEDAGFPVPQKVRPCGAGKCPQWHSGDWTPCENSRCFNWKTAMQRRDVSCRLVGDTDKETDNATILESNKCDDSRRPLQRQECYNDACKGVWRVGEWSECSASCEADGIKYRILQCVWYGTKKPAGNACRDMSRPPVMKTCKGSSCQQSSDECKDLSQRCFQVKLMNMCRVPLYQKQCCETCR